MAKPRLKPLAPVDIVLPERVLLEDGVMFVTLRTLDELEQFWTEHMDQFQFACEGKNVGDAPCFLREYEWVFGSSKTAVVRTVMRWGRSGIGCEFYNWAESDPDMYEFWFGDRENFRASAIKKARWSAQDEADYLQRTPETYRGWWRFCGLPKEYNADEWFSPVSEHDELIDPTMSPIQVAEILHEQTFDEWEDGNEREVVAHDRESIAETISYWRNERASGQGYYGDENLLEE
jgi:hypothetical protein